MTVREMHLPNRAAWNEVAAHYADDLEERIQFLDAGVMNFCAAKIPNTFSLLTWKD